MSATQGPTPADPPHTEEDKLRIAKVEHVYFIEKRPLFKRETLESIRKIVADYRAGKYEKGETPSLKIPDYVEGDERSYTITLDLGLHEDELKVLQYFPIQKLMNPYWYRFQTGFAEQHGPPNPIMNDSRFPFWGERKEDPSTEVEEFKTMLSEAKESWKKSATRESLLSTLQENKVKEQVQKVTKIIAFGLGSLWHAFRCDKKFNGFASWAAQHAAVEEVRTYIKARFNPHVRSYAQDPHYASKDKELVLDVLEIEQLEDPDGTLEIDGGTLVFAMYPSFPLLQLIADLPLAKPPIIFHDQVERNENWQQYKDAVVLGTGQPRPKKGTEPNPTSPRVEELLLNYKEYTINDPDRLFGGDRTRLYVLK